MRINMASVVDEILDFCIQRWGQNKDTTTTIRVVTERMNRENSCYGFAWSITENKNSNVFVLAIIDHFP